MNGKRMAAMLLCCLMALPFASARGEGYRLVPFDPLEGVDAVTVESESAPCTVTEEWVSAHGAEAEGAVDGETVGYAGNLLRQTVGEEMLPDAIEAWFGALPDGETFLCVAGRMLCAYRQGTLRILTMDLTRSRPSPKTGFQPAIRLMLSAGSAGKGIGAQGIPASPDGRFLLLNRAGTVYRMMRSDHGLTLADLESGQLFMAEPGGNLMPGKEEAVGVWSGTFDAEGTLWYIATVSGETSLYRMDPRSASSGKVLSFQDAGLRYPYCEGMGMDAEGRIRFVGYTAGDEKTVFCAYDPGTGSLTAEETPFSRESMLYPRLYTVTPGGEWLTAVKAGPEKDKESVVFLHIRDGEVRQAVIEENSLRLLPLSEAPEETVWEPLLQAAPAPDGSRVFLLTRDLRTGRYKGYCADPETMETEPVDLQWLNDLAQNKIRVPAATGGDDGKAGICKAGISFTGDGSLLVIPFMDNGAMLARLSRD